MSQYPCRFKYLKRNLTSLFRKWHSGRKSILGLERENRTHYLQKHRCVPFLSLCNLWKIIAMPTF